VRALVTGGAGFVGRLLVSSLVAEGCATWSLQTTTVSLSTCACAGTNFPSAPAMVNQSSGLPSRDLSPPKT